MKNHTINTDCIEAVNNGRSVPKRLEGFTIKYVQTDGWRGYFEAVPTKKSRWEKLDEGSITGAWEDAPGETPDTLEEKVERMAEELARDKKELIIIMMPTSNVFSTCYDIFSRNI